MEICHLPVELKYGLYSRLLLFRLVYFNNVVVLELHVFVSILFYLNKSYIFSVVN